MERGRIQGLPNFSSTPYYPVDVTSAPSLFTFRKRLKLHLFTLSYPGLVY